MIQFVTPSGFSALDECGHATCKTRGFHSYCMTFVQVKPKSPTHKANPPVLALLKGYFPAQSKPLQPPGGISRKSMLQIHLILFSLGPWTMCRMEPNTKGRTERKKFQLCCQSPQQWWVWYNECWCEDRHVLDLPRCRGEWWGAGMFSWRSSQKPRRAREHSGSSWNPWSRSCWQLWTSTWCQSLGWGAGKYSLWTSSLCTLRILGPKKKKKKRILLPKKKS